MQLIHHLHAWLRLGFVLNFNNFFRGHACVHEVFCCILAKYIKRDIEKMGLPKVMVFPYKERIQISFNFWASVKELVYLKKEDIEVKITQYIYILYVEYDLSNIFTSPDSMREKLIDDFHDIFNYFCYLP